MYRLLAAHVIACFFHDLAVKPHVFCVCKGMRGVAKWWQIGKRSTVFKAEDLESGGPDHSPFENVDLVWKNVLNHAWTLEMKSHSALQTRTRLI